MIRLRLSLIALIGSFSLAGAADKLPPELAVIPNDAAVVISLRQDLLRKSPLAKSLLSIAGMSSLLENIERHWLGFPVAEIERATVVFPNFADRFSTEESPVFIVTHSEKIDRAKMLQSLKAKNTLPWRIRPGDKIPDRSIQPGELWRIQKGTLLFVGDRTVLLGTGREEWDSEKMVLHMLAQSIDRTPDGPLSPAIAAAQNNLLVAGIRSSVLKELLQAIPEKGEEFAALGDAKSVTLVANLEPDFHLALRAEFPDEATARAALPVAARLAKWAAEFVKAETEDMSPDELKLISLLLGWLKGAGEPRADGKALIVDVKIKGDEFAKLAAAAIKAGDARLVSTTDQRRCANALKQMGLAVHNFCDTVDYFPFKQRPRDVLHPGLSWRVALLPFVEEDSLYRQFRQDEPWDSESNKKLIEKMPKIFAPPPGVKAKPGHTFYRMIDGPDSIFRSKRRQDVADGLANTLMIVEGGESEIWTKPDELEYDPKKPLPNLGGHFKNGLNVLFGDGSVMFVKKPINEKLFRAWITASGGEAIRKQKK